MIEINARCILLDIEGTTSSVSFVYDVLFPFARDHMEDFLQRRWCEDAVKAALDRLARDAGLSGLDGFGDSSRGENEQARDRAMEVALGFMDSDVKATGLKELQGLIWAEGYESGELKSHVYPDVVDALPTWKERGIDLKIYSSGSVHAQKIFFQNSEYGDLTKFFSGHYDTTTGPKKDAASYRAICQDAQVSPEETAFLSDVPAELEAAAEAGIEAVLVVRPGNAPVAESCRHPKISSFAELDARASGRSLSR